MKIHAGAEEKQNWDLHMKLDPLLSMRSRTSCCENPLVSNHYCQALAFRSLISCLVSHDSRKCRVCDLLNVQCSPWRLVVGKYICLYRRDKSLSGL